MTSRTDNLFQPPMVYAVMSRVMDQSDASKSLLKIEMSAFLDVDCYEAMWAFHR